MQRLGALDRRAGARGADRLGRRRPQLAPGAAPGRRAARSNRPGSRARARRNSPPARVDRRGIGEVAGIELLDEGAVAAIEEGGLLELASLGHRSSHLRSRCRARPESWCGCQRPLGRRQARASKSLALSRPSPRPSPCRLRPGSRRSGSRPRACASIFSSAPPLPPEMIAPAWPMRRPGGAVRPAMKPTIGFLRPSRLEERRRILLGACRRSRRS